jgi:hypothetical protein
MHLDEVRLGNQEQARGMEHVTKGVYRNGVSYIGQGRECGGECLGSRAIERKSRTSDGSGGIAGRHGRDKCPCKHSSPTVRA